LRARKEKPKAATNLKLPSPKTEFFFESLRRLHNLDLAGVVVERLQPEPLEQVSFQKFWLEDLRLIRQILPRVLCPRAHRALLAHA
jgi:hypothetical protein